jgi:hypothetical protein
MTGRRRTETPAATSALDAEVERGMQPDSGARKTSPYWAIDVELNYTGNRGSDLNYQPGPKTGTYFLDRNGPKHA